MLAKVINFVGFELVWFGCVLSGSRDLVWAGPILAGCFVAYTIYTSKQRQADVALLVLALLAGVMLDSVWSLSGVMSYRGGLSPLLAPPWILGLWAGFALTLNHSLAWLRYRPIAMACLSAIACPFSYYAGSKLGAVSWQQPIILLTLAPLSWALVFPLLGYINRQLLRGGHDFIAD